MTDGIQLTRPPAALRDHRGRPVLLRTLSVELGDEAMIKSSVDLSNQP
jgi:hypothetical protein